MTYRLIAQSADPKIFDAFVIIHHVSPNLGLMFALENVPSCVRVNVLCRPEFIGWRKFETPAHIVLWKHESQVIQLWMKSNDWLTS